MDGHGLLEILLCHRFQRRHQHNTGIINEYIYAAMISRNRGDRAFDALGILDVARPRRGLRAGIPQVVSCALKLFFIPRQERDLGSMAGEFPR